MAPAAPLASGDARPARFRRLESDPADRLLDLRLLQARDRHAVDHGEGNVLDVDIEVAQVFPVELAVSADVFLECDAPVLQNLLDPPAAFAVGPRVDDDFHVALCLRCAPARPGVTHDLIALLSNATSTLSSEVVFVQFYSPMRSIDDVDIITLYFRFDNRRCRP